MAFYMDWSSFDPTVSPKNNFLTDKIADKAGESEFYLKRFSKVAMVDYLVVNQVQGHEKLAAICVWFSFEVSFAIHWKIHYLPKVNWQTALIPVLSVFAILTIEQKRHVFTWLWNFIPNWPKKSELWNDLP